MILSTARLCRFALQRTPQLEGRPIREYKGEVTGEVIIGANAIVGIDIDYETIGANGSLW